jgi:hypothetical protein
MIKTIQCTQEKDKQWDYYTETKDLATQTPLKTEDPLWFSR